MLKVGKIYRANNGYYIVKIISCVFEREGGQDNRWVVRMQFVSSSRNDPAFVDPP